MMSIIFGNLTQSFVNFGAAIQQAANPGSDPNVLAAAAHFRHTASKDASYLVYIGLGMLVATFVYMNAWVYTAEAASKRIREKYLRVCSFPMLIILAMI